MGMIQDKCVAMGKKKTQQPSSKKCRRLQCNHQGLR